MPEGPLAILDWGIRALPRPALLVDHAMPEVAPRDDQVFLSGYGEIPVIPTSVLMRRVERDAPLWLAEIGIAKEIGAEHVSADVRQLAALVDAPRRVPHGPVATALELLTRHAEVVETLADQRVADLDDARRAWKSELERVLRAEPEETGDGADRALRERVRAGGRRRPLLGAAPARPPGRRGPQRHARRRRRGGPARSVVTPTGACATLMDVPLTLVTGPANAEKARVVLDGYRARGRRGRRCSWSRRTRRRAALPPRARRRRARVRDGHRALPAAGERDGASRRRPRAGPLPPAARARRGRRDRGRAAGRPAALRRHRRVPRRRWSGSRASSSSGRVDPARASRARCAPGAAGTRAPPTRRSSRRCTPATAARWRRPVAPTTTCASPPRGRAAARTRRAGARGPVFVYGFDDLRPLQRDAIETLAATEAPRSPSR